MRLRCPYILILPFEGSGRPGFFRKKSPGRYENRPLTGDCVPLNTDSQFEPALSGEKKGNPEYWPRNGWFFDNDPVKWRKTGYKGPDGIYPTEDPAKADHVTL
jgi:hypothetical protein